MQKEVARIIALGIAATFVFTAAVASAQDEKVISDEYGVEVSKPKGWEKSTGNEKAVAVFSEPKSQSQIEVVPAKLMTAEVAEVFFNTFHKTLTESSFEKVGETVPKDVKGIKAQETTYKFTHSGVTLKVCVVSFTRDTTAWLVVGYMQDKEEAKIKPQFDALLDGMVFK